MSDLRQRVPGHSLIEQLLREWDLGNIHPGKAPGEIVIDDEARGWYLGVHGERWVATRLALLGPEYTVLHSVPVGRGDSDIDHIVVGPTGVFTLNTKFSPGRRIWSAGWGVYVGDREEKHFIRNLDLDLRRAEDRLSRSVGFAVHVTGLLVFVDPLAMNRKAPAGDGSRDLRVISDAELLSTIGGHRILSDEQVASIGEAAVRPTTWHDSPRESTIGTHIAREFSALEEAVGSLATAGRPAPSASRGTRSLSRSSTAPRRPAATQRRTRTRRKKSARLEALVGAAAFLGLAWLLSRPEGQALIQGGFAALLLR
jgi:hypothetical protein